MRAIRASRTALGLAVLAVAVVYLAGVVEADAGRQVGQVGRAVIADPLGLVFAVACYALAFLVRARAWTAVLTHLRLGQAWAAIHIALAGNHVLPLRLGEPLRVTSVLRRTDLAAGPVTASAITLRLGDVLAVLVLALVAVPGLAVRLAGGWGVVAGLGLGLLAAVAGCLVWLRRLARTHRGVRVPYGAVAAAAVVAWAFEAAVVLEIARVAGLDLSPYEALAVTAVTVAAQMVGVTPGGFGSYEAAATAALVALGAEEGLAFGVALTTHAVKTLYSLAVGAVALAVPAPGYLGRLRLPRVAPPRPEPWPVDRDAPVVAFMPVHNEGATVGRVLRRLPAEVCGRPLLRVVVDDGSTDASAALAARAGAIVVRHPRNLGLGAAMRRGLAEALAYRPAAVVYLDADGEYAPEDIEAVAGPVLRRSADYVVGSRFAGGPRLMRPYRRLGNRLLTVWVRWLTRRTDLSDGQSGYRAFSPRAAAHAEVIHDYNYAQVLTLDLLAKGYRYAEAPISYAYRDSGTSFVRLGQYLRRVVPAVHRQLNAPPTPPPSAPAGSAAIRPATVRPPAVLLCPPFVRDQAETSTPVVDVSA